MSAIPAFLNFRIEPRVRYLLDVASRAKGVSLTNYVESVLVDSFASVTLRRPEEREPIYGDHTDPHNPNKLTMPTVDDENERVQNDAMSIANRADDLWSDSEFVRIRSLSILAPHLLSEEEAGLLSYIHSQADLRKKVGGGYQLKREKIEDSWEATKAHLERERKLKK